MYRLEFRITSFLISKIFLHALKNDFNVSTVHKQFFNIFKKHTISIPNYTYIIILNFSKKISLQLLE